MFFYVWSIESTPVFVVVVCYYYYYMVSISISKY